MNKRLEAIKQFFKTATEDDIAVMAHWINTCLEVRSIEVRLDNKVDRRRTRGKKEEPNGKV